MRVLRRARSMSSKPSCRRRELYTVSKGMRGSLVRHNAAIVEFRLLTQNLLHPGTVRTIFKYDGLRGFYRGLGPTILGYLPTWAIYFAVYDGIKTAFGEMPLGSVSDSQQERIYPAAQTKGYQPVAREHPWSLHILSAMAAGAASTTCTTPLWVIKTRFMVSHVFGIVASC